MIIDDIQSMQLQRPIEDAEALVSTSIRSNGVLSLHQFNKKNVAQKDLKWTAKKRGRLYALMGRISQKITKDSAEMEIEKVQQTMQFTRCGWSNLGKF